MIADDKERMIVDLLAQNSLSQREIARIVNMSRSIVSRIATGCRIPNHEQRYHAKRAYNRTQQSGYCTACQKECLLPCVVCEARRNDNNTRRLYRQRVDQYVDNQLELDLAADEQARMLELRIMKQRLGELRNFETVEI